MQQKIEHYTEVDQSVYDFQFHYTKDFHWNYAFRYFKRNISYNTSKKQIETIAKILYSNKVGAPVKKGEVIAVISPMFPEVVSAFYAIAKCGATFFPIDPRTNASRIRDFLNLAEVKQAFVIDAAFGKLDAIIDQTLLENVVVISAMDSMIPGLGFLYHHDQMKKTKNYYRAIQCLDFDDPARVAEAFEFYKNKLNRTKEDQKMIQNLKIYMDMRDTALKNLYYTNPPKLSSTSGYISLKEATNLCKNDKECVSVYDPNVPASLTLTSGTTGKPKVVPTKHKSYNVKVRDYSYTTMPIEVGDRILSMPPFILYGEVFMHMAYVRGVQNVIIPDITQYHYPDVIMKEKISHGVGVPSQALTLYNDKKFNQKLPKTLKSFSVGGTKMLKEHEEKINQTLGKLGIQITQGYSMTEQTPASMTNMPGMTKSGSIGRLLGNTIALVVNLETGEILGPNEIGSLLVHSETQFEGYYKNPDETKKVLIEFHGQTYIKSGDLSYYDEEGYYYVIGRDKEMIIRPDGHNIFPSELEELLVSHPYVEDCAVVGVPYPNYDSPLGEYPKAHVVLRKEYVSKEIAAEELLKQYCLENLPERDVPYYYLFHDQLPLTPVLKTDKLALQELDRKIYVEQKTAQTSIVRKKTL